QRDSYRIPISSPFLAQMMPRISGAIKLHGTELGLEPQSFTIAHQIEKQLLKPVIQQSKAIKQLELEIFNLALADNDTHTLADKIDQLANAKRKLSHIQAGCIHDIFVNISATDKEKLRIFFNKNKNLMLNRHHFIF
ncbi:MAG: hypothetical protein JRG71_16785, partial [Deltaproteobacteria bacterium]|nr:hypothetical protein [Deltaproteobacteria bacterium]